MQNPTGRGASRSHSRLASLQPLGLTHEPRCGGARRESQQRQSRARKSGVPPRDGARAAPDRGSSPLHHRYTSTVRRTYARTPAVHTSRPPHGLGRGCAPGRVPHRPATLVSPTRHQCRASATRPIPPANAVPAAAARDGLRDGRRACHAEDRILHRWIQVMTSRVMASRTTKTTSPTTIATPMTRARARRRTAAGRRPTKDSMGVGLCRRRFGFQSRTRGEHTRRLCHSNSLRSPAYLTLALLLTHRTPSTLSMDDSCDCGSSKVPMSNAIVVSRPPLPPVLPPSSLGHCRCLSCHRCFDQGCGDVPIGQTASMSRASAHHIHSTAGRVPVFRTLNRQWFASHHKDRLLHCPYLCCCWQAIRSGTSTPRRARNS